MVVVIRPLPPVFVNERARLEEHERFLSEARIRYGVRNICPDCYLPPAQCQHVYLPRSPR